MIKYRKLKSQIKKLDESKGGYMFLATEDQKKNFVLSVVFLGASKRKALQNLSFIIHHDEDFSKYFKL